MSRSLKLVAILAFATFAVAACGKRGLLEPPEGATKAESANLPKESKKSKGLSSKSGSIDPSDRFGTAKPNTKPETEEEHRPFVLDDLLR